VGVEVGGVSVQGGGQPAQGAGVTVDPRPMGPVQLCHVSRVARRPQVRKVATRSLIRPRYRFKGNDQLGLVAIDVRGA
jgi:hypothetical protein